jgi:hypothetical protein
LLVIIFFISIGCKNYSQKEGNIVKIDYQKAEINSGDWIQIDSFRFRHIGKRKEAREYKYPLPSNKVDVGGEISMRSRDYNPKTLPIYISKYLQKINKALPKNKEYLVMNRFLVSYKGVLKIMKRDSSQIVLKSSPKYDASILTKTIKEQ